MPYVAKTNVMSSWLHISGSLKSMYIHIITYHKEMSTCFMNKKLSDASRASPRTKLEEMVEDP